MTRAVPQAAIEMIKAFEKFEPVAYLPTPNDVPTIGYGHTKTLTRRDLGRTTISHQRAEELLRADMQEAVDRLYRHCGRAVMDQFTENEYAALVSFVFNCGLDPDWRMTAAIKAVDRTAIPERMMKFDKQAGKVLRGLVRRRTAEVELFRKR